MRWDGGWNGISGESPKPGEVPVIVRAKNSNLRRTRDVVLDETRRPERLREHSFFLCTVCLLLFDEDDGFKERLASKASGYASRG